MDSNEYARIKDLTLRILQQYPPSEYHYIGIGASPTPVIAFLEALGIDGITAIPLSGMRMFPYFAGVGEYRGPTEGTKILFEHFENTLPSEGKVSNKRMLVIDFSEYGASLENTKRYLKEYFARVNRTTEVETLSITKQDNMDAMRKRVDHAIAIGDDWYREFMDHKYRTMAKYGRFDPLKDPLPDMKERDSYQQFRKSLSEQIALDAGLIPMICNAKYSRILKK